jgi:hypothetical protein
MKGRVIQVIVATVLSTMSVGCATSRTSAHGSRYSNAQVEVALQETECSALTRMAASIDPETAQAAREMAIGECR